MISIFNFFASSIISELNSSLVSKIIGFTPFFLNSIAVSYAVSLFVKIIGFLPTRTPYIFMYSFAPEDKITPGVSLFPKTIGLSIEPVDSTTSFALMYHNLCLGKNLFFFSKWSDILSNITSILWS